MTHSNKHPLHQAIFTEGATAAPVDPMRATFEERIAPKEFNRPDLVARDEHGAYVLPGTWDLWQLWRAAWQAATAADAKSDPRGVLFDVMVGSDYASGRLLLCGMARTGDITHILTERSVELESDLIHKKLVARGWTPPGHSHG